MNQAGRDALRAAGLAGVPQIYGRPRDHHRGRCAMGLLLDALIESTRYTGCSSTLSAAYDLDHLTRCPLCNDVEVELLETGLLAHLNDDHRCDFLKIAELMPVTDAP